VRWNVHSISNKNVLKKSIFHSNYRNYAQQQNWRLSVSLPAKYGSREISTGGRLPQGKKTEIKIKIKN